MKPALDRSLTVALAKFKTEFNTCAEATWDNIRYTPTV
jgi:hypothetical protein